MMSTKFWIKINNQEIGPLSYKDLYDYNLDENSQLWTPGMEEWKPMKSLQFCMNYLNQKKEKDKILDDLTEKHKRATKRNKCLSNTLKVNGIIMIVFIIFQEEYDRIDIFWSIFPIIIAITILLTIVNFINDLKLGLLALKLNKYKNNEFIKD